MAFDVTESSSDSVTIALAQPMGGRERRGCSHGSVNSGGGVFGALIFVIGILFAFAVLFGFFLIVVLRLFGRNRRDVGQ